MPKILAPLDLQKNEIQNATIQNLATNPASPRLGQIYYNTVSNRLRICVNTSPETWTDLTASLDTGNAFSVLSDGSSTASADSQADTMTFASGNNRLTTDVTDTGGNATVTLTVNEGNIHHGALAGLGDDDHPQYARLFGRSGGQSFTGGLGGSDALTLSGTNALSGGTLALQANSVQTGTVNLDSADFNVTLSGSFDINANSVNFNGTVISGVSTPSAATDAANKAYVDSEIGSLTTDHGELTGLGDDDHTQYVHISNARTISAGHTFSASQSFTNATVPFSVTSTNLVDNLNADRVDGAHATSTPSNNSIPISNGSNKLAAGWISNILSVGDLTTGTTGSGNIVLANSPTIVTPTISSFANAQHDHEDAAGGGKLDHGAALNGLLDDDHTQYALLAGRSGGQSIHGGTGSGDSFQVRGTNAASGGTLNLRANTTASSAQGTISAVAGTFSVNADTVNFNNNRLQNVAYPTSDTDAANKLYVDNIAVGLTDYKDSVRMASTSNVNITTVTSIDGVTITNGDRVLIKNQTDASQNGIYVYAGDALVRAPDANSDVEVTSGMHVYVEEGSQNATSSWVLTTTGPITVGTTDLTFVQFSGAGQINAGLGLTKTGNTLNVGSGSGIAVNADNIALTGQALAFHDLNSNGIVARTGSGSVAARSINTANSNRISISNGDGVSGNPTIDVGSQVVLTTGSYANPSWVTSLAGSKITGNISGNAANVTGTVAVGNGGTGATTAAGAKTNLGFTTRHSATITGNGVAQSFTVNHNFGTRDVKVEVIESASPYDVVIPNIRATGSNSVDVIFGIPPSNGTSYRVNVFN